MTRAARLDREIAAVLAARLPIVEIDPWDTWHASPFPYAPKPIVPARLHETAKVTRIALGLLTSSQRRVTDRGLAKYAKGYKSDNLPLVYVGASGKFYIVDGNHRLAAQWLAGRPGARVRLVDVGDAY
jgi:hypothetical protein